MRSATASFLLAGCLLSNAASADDFNERFLAQDAVTETLARNRSDYTNLVLVQSCEKAFPTLFDGLTVARRPSSAVSDRVVMKLTYELSVRFSLDPSKVSFVNDRRVDYAMSYFRAFLDGAVDHNINQMQSDIVGFATICNRYAVK